MGEKNNKKIKALHVNTSDIQGRAARAAFRLNQALNKLNVNLLKRKKYLNYFILQIR
jgi:hypothetical protein